MVEKKLVIDQLKLSYEGLFDFSELYRLIDGFFFERGYDKVEVVNQEQVTSGGKQIRIIMEPEKGITDYFKLIVKIRLHAIDLKEIEVEKDKAKLRLNQGQLKITFDGYVISDRSGTWEKSPFFWLIRVFSDKFIFRDHYNKAEKWLVSDIEDLQQKIKSFLNLHRYRGMESGRKVYEI